MAHQLSFRKYKLKNGLTVYWQKRNLTWDALSVVVWAGYRYERPEAVQVTHALEHLMTCGTIGYDYPAKDIIKFRDWCLERGFLADDAATWMDAMQFDGVTTTREHLPALLQFMADMVLHPTLDRGWEKERALIKAERDEEQCSVRREHQRLLDEALYGDHFIVEHGRKPDDDVLDATTMAEIREHHARLFHPKNMALVVVSGAKFKDVRPLLETAFAVDHEFVPSPAPPPIAYPPAPAEPVYSGASRKRNRDIELEYYWRLPPSQMPYLEISRRVIESMLTSRIREKLRGTYDVTVNKDVNLDNVYLCASMNIPKRLLKRVMATIKSSLNNRRALAALIGPELRAYAHDGLTVDMDAAETVEYAVEYVGMKRSPPPALDLTTRIERLKPDAVLAFILENFRPEDAVVSILETDK
jgi:predicted Zn-dependent peptidase